MESTHRNAPGLLSVLAIMSLSFITMASANITPGLASISASFPDVPANTVYMLYTIPSIFAIVATIVSGAVTGKKVKFRTMGILGNLLWLVGGCGPFLFHDSMAVMLVFRAVFGIGVGLTMPLLNPVIMGNFEGQKRATFLGIGSLTGSIVGAIMTILAGVLANISWPLLFLSNLFAALAIVLLIFLPEPPLIEQAKSEDKSSRSKVSPFTWVIVLTLMLMVLFYSAPMMNVSSIVVERGIGGAAEAGLATSGFMIGAAVGGLANGLVYKIFGRRTIGVSLLVLAVGSFLVYIGQSVTLIAIGFFVIGAVYTFAMLSLFMLLGMKNEMTALALASALAMAGLNLATFITPFYLSFAELVTGGAVDGYMVFGTAGYAVLGILYLVFNPVPKQAPQGDAVKPVSE